MAEIVSVTKGAMDPLLGKLTTLIGDECKKLTGVRKQASFLKDELSAMNAALENLELMDGAPLDPVTKDWRDHVTEMAYDMENCIDDSMPVLGGANASEGGFVKKASRRLRTLRVRRRVADKMAGLKDLEMEANKRRMRYDSGCRVPPCASLVVSGAAGSVAVDPRMSAMYKEAAWLVGVDGPREELVGWLTGGSEKKLKVVSIVGFGGLGKTTLAKQVYDQIGEKFDFKAFFSVSQRPDVMRLIVGLQRKLGLGESSPACDVQDIVDRLRQHLGHKRYLIVVDDCWDETAWDQIRCAFPESGNGSRVIVTTRVDGVAAAACRNDQDCIYIIKPLDEGDSRKLFFNRVFGSEQDCPPQLKEVSSEILKCGGLPLAVITIASLLASRPARLRDDWESIRNSLSSHCATNPTLEGMNRILNLSYMDLPRHLRACFLYLGIYPEDHVIGRDDLVWQWVAEGLVSNLHGQNPEDVGKTYFNQLINRNLIQPERTQYGEVLSCKVHDMMLDLVLSKCAEENFLSVAYSFKEARLHECKYNVRRLSLNSRAGGALEEDAVPATVASSLSQVRSLAWFGKSGFKCPVFPFKYLRVLFFDITCDRIGLDLTDIGQLCQLRYLKVLGPKSQAWFTEIKLPRSFEGFVHLETLEIDYILEVSIP